MKVVTYELLEGGSAIRCLVCLSDSHNPNAVVERTCPQCGVNHDQLATRIERAMRENWKVERASRTLRRAASRR